MPKPAKTDGPSLQDYPEYVEAEEKLHELSRRKTDLDRRVRDLQVEFAEKHGNRAPNPQNAEIDAEAAKLLGKPLPAPSRAAECKRQLEEARRELAIVNRAAEAQTGEVKGLQRRLSVEICKQLAPKHRELAVDVARALIRLIEVSRAESDFRDELEARGVSVRAPIVPASWKPWKGLEQAIFGHHLKDLEHHIPGITQQALEREGVDDGDDC